MTKGMRKFICQQTRITILCVVVGTLIAWYAKWQLMLVLAALLHFWSDPAYQVVSRILIGSTPLFITAAFYCFYAPVANFKREFRIVKKMGDAY
jgi:predicted lysophospholipase L1 biosynthesis ABC-type transport system permease subunit